MENHAASHEGERGHRAHDHASMIADFRRRFRVSLILTIPVIALSPMIRRWVGLEGEVAGAGAISLILAAIIYFYGGWPFLAGLAADVAARRPGMMTLIGMAISVAFFYSTAVVLGLEGEPLFWELASLIDIMLLGHWIEMRSVLGASRALEHLVMLMPATAHRLDGGRVEEVAVSGLRRGDLLLVRPGEKVPIDGVIREGESSLNEAMLTGESRPVERGGGQRVIGGAINGEGSLTVEVTRTGDETYLAQVIELVRRAQASRSRTQDLADRAALWLTVIAISVGGATLGAWLAVGGGAGFAVERMVTVMVIACPHALGLAVPLVVAVSSALSAQRGLLVRDRGAFERARGIDAIVFDKTGTLTEGRFGVTDLIPLGATGEGDLLRLAASLEWRSEHPIARAIAALAHERGIEPLPVEGFRALPGKGAQGSIAGREVKVVSPGHLKELGIPIRDERVTRAAGQGKTVVYLLTGGRVEGAIALADIIRPESREAVARLRGMGIRVMMLTGDAEPVARWVAGELGVEEFFAEVLPDRKAAEIEAIRKRGRRVAMVGDGINDAPALVAADVGIAIGAGTDVAVESADIVLVRSDPRDVVAVVGLARATYAKMVQNLWWAAGYNIVAIPLATGLLINLGVILSPAAGAVLMSLSTVIVAINARLLDRAYREGGGAHHAGGAPHH